MQKRILAFVYDEDGGWSTGEWAVITAGAVAIGVGLYQHLEVTYQDDTTVFFAIDQDDTNLATKAVNAIVGCSCGRGGVLGTLPVVIWMRWAMQVAHYLDQRPIAKNGSVLQSCLTNLLFKSFSLHGLVLGSKGNSYARTLNSSKFRTV